MYLLAVTFDSLPYKSTFENFFFMLKFLYILSNALQVLKYIYIYSIFNTV